MPVGQNVQSASSNIGSEIVYVKGAKLGPADIGTLASFGVTRCSVFRNPVIGVISVGSKVKMKFKRGECHHFLNGIPLLFHLT